MTISLWYTGVFLVAIAIGLALNTPFPVFFLMGIACLLHTAARVMP